MLDPSRETVEAARAVGAALRDQVSGRSGRAVLVGLGPKGARHGAAQHFLEIGIRGRGVVRAGWIPAAVCEQPSLCAYLLLLLQADAQLRKRSPPLAGGRGDATVTVTVGRGGGGGKAGLPPRPASVASNHSAAGAKRGAAASGGSEAKRPKSAAPSLYRCEERCGAALLYLVQCQK